MSTLAATVSAPEDARSLAFRLALLAMVGTALPFKGIFLLLPFIALALLLWEREDCSQLLFWVGVLASVSAISMIIDLMRGRDVSIPGLLFAIVDYMPLLLVFCCSRVRLAFSAREERRIIDWLAWFVIGESLIGFVQFAIIRDADDVGGTFALLSKATIVQVYFTFALLMTLFVLHRYVRRPLVLAAMACGVAATAIAQSGHQTVFTLVAIGIVALASRGAPRWTRIGLLAVGGLLAFLTVYFYPHTYIVGRMWVDKIWFNPESSKRLLVSSILTELSDPKNLFIGTGLGQYCSRAAFIASGHYLTSVTLPSFLVSKSTYFVKHMQPLIYLFDRSGEGSAISKPYFSAASWLVETGVVLTGVVVVTILREFCLLLRCLRSGDEALAGPARTMLLMLLVFVLCTVIEDYAEFAWSDFLPAILYLITRSELMGALESGAGRLPATDGASRSGRAPQPGPLIGIHRTARR